MPFKKPDPETIARDELRKLGKAQQRLLPRHPPATPGFDICLAFRPAFIATGDYYDFFRRPDGRYATFIGDGSGHGPSACMLMAMMRALLHTHPEIHTGAGATLKAVGRMFRQLIPSDMFMTGVYLILDSAGWISWAAAGHHPPIRVKSDGSIPPVDTNLGDVPLGIQIDDEIEYPTVTWTLEPGERLILFTDGLYEAQNEHAEKFGRRRLLDYLEQNRSIPLRQTIDGLVELAITHTEAAEFEDDFTLIGIERWHHLG